MLFSALLSYAEHNRVVENFAPIRPQERVLTRARDSYIRLTEKLGLKPIPEFTIQQFLSDNQAFEGDEIIILSKKIA